MRSNRQLGKVESQSSFPKPVACAELACQLWMFWFCPNFEDREVLMLRDECRRIRMSLANK